MPYGHIRQYQNLVREARNKRIAITDKQKRQIAKLYRDVAKDFGQAASKKSDKTLTYRWLKDYGKALRNESKSIYQELQGVVTTGIYDTATAVTEAELQFWGGIVPSLSLRFRDTMSSIPQTCVDELMSGGIYKDFTGLSERLWDYKKKFDTDIGYIINRGIIEQKTALELAKDLELYLQPSAKKPWEWRKVYPNSSAIVDYNAQRLARTAITHAYQMSFQRSTIDNPFIEGYEWNSSNAGKTCELCRERDGRIFPKDKVPLDHPNGMCIITAVINKSMDEIADELSDWKNGGYNPALGKWLGASDMEGDLGDKLYGLSHPAIRKKLNKFEQQLGKIGNKDVRILLLQSKDRVNFRQTKERASYFSAQSNMVSLSVDADMGSIAHELFHEIDTTYGITKNGALRDSLRKDYKKLVVSAQASGKNVPDMLYSLYPEMFRMDDSKKVLIEYRGISDILNGLSGGDVWLGYGHSNGYWKKMGRLEAETWAQFGRILFLEDDEVIKFASVNFPNVYKEILGIIERMMK